MMTIIDQLFERPQFSIPQAEKESLLLKELQELTEIHRVTCEPYGKILAALSKDSPSTLDQLPFMPVGMFKSHDLVSIPKEEVFKVMTSSGTTGQAVSRIFLDRKTADLQTRALASIIRSVLGSQRLPMIVVDTPRVVKDRHMFSARGAGVLGMLTFGRHHFYALDDEMNLDVDGLQKFVERHEKEPLLIFGFTFMVWKYFFRAIEDLQVKMNLSNATLIHSGGWKKLTEEAISNSEFKLRIAEIASVTRCHNFYGMVEQVGAVFLEGKDGYLYPSNYSDVLIRDPRTLQPLPFGEAGLVEVLSVLPRSYPGHVLLTEDLGVIHGIADGENGWTGKQLEIMGRIPKAEIRGCSDTHAYDQGD